VTKKILGAGVIASAALLLAACGGGGSSSEGSGSSSSAMASSSMSTSESSSSSSSSGSGSSGASASASASGGSSSGSHSAATAVGVDVPATNGFDPLGTGTVFQGSIDVSTSDANALDENYAVSNGQVTLNLQDLKPLDKDKAVNVYVDVGTVSVTLPDDVPVEMTAKDSVTLTTPSHKTYNESASGKKLTLNVQVNNGPVTIAE